MRVVIFLTVSLCLNRHSILAYWGRGQKMQSFLCKLAKTWTPQYHTKHSALTSGVVTFKDRVWTIVGYEHTPIGVLHAIVHTTWDWTIDFQAKKNTVSLHSVHGSLYHFEAHDCMKPDPVKYLCLQTTIFHNHHPVSKLTNSFQSPGVLISVFPIPCKSIRESSVTVCVVNIKVETNLRFLGSL